MNHPHQSERTRARSGPPVFNPGLSARDLPTTQKNETNPISGSPDKILTTDDWRLKAAFNKTNPICHPNGPKIRNEPNLHPAHVQKCETNPIPTRFKPTTLAEGQSRFIGKPNLPYYHHPNNQKMRNEPNFRPDGRNTKD